MTKQVLVTWSQFFEIFSLFVNEKLKKICRQRNGFSKNVQFKYIPKFVNRK